MQLYSDRRDSASAQARSDRRRVRRAVGLVGVVLCTLVGGSVLAPRALAAAPVCPDRPADLEAAPEGEQLDPVVVELRALRQENADSCTAIREGVRDGSEVVANGLDSVGLAGGQVVELGGPVQLDRGDSADAPLHVSTGDVAGTVSLTAQSRDALVEASAATGQTVHKDLWFLIGLAAAALPALGLYRVVMPRA